MKSEDIFIYNSDDDTLYIQVDKAPNSDNIITIDSVELQVYLDINATTGGLIRVEIVKPRDIIKRSPAGPVMTYNSELDALYIYLADGNQEELCDLIFHNTSNGTMVTLNRNDVGNLVGIEILGLECIVESFDPVPAR